MGTYRTKLLIGLLLTCVFQLLAETKLADIYDSVLIKYATVKYYEADFEQENYWKEMDIMQKSAGRVYFDFDNFLMEYAEPKGQFILVQNDTVTLYDAASNQAIISNNMGIELRPVKLISEYWENSQKQLEYSEGNVVKLLMQTDAERISLTLENYMLVELLIQDNDDNFVVYKFKNAKINEELPPHIFQKKIPDDANLIDQTK